MSGAVDTKTVEMRFDNANFEKNAGQSISTLEKLKRALKLDGASAGLKEVEKVSKKLDFKDYKGNIDSVGKRFNVLETIATGALLKIGASAAEAGMRLAKSLTVDQLAAGWSKYADKTTAVQTIMANLREDEAAFVSEAEKLEYVNSYLNKLLWFSDETSYSFTDMTSNVGKFIANGQGLKESVTAMQGIAAWAAVSGQNAQVAARAMYNISQALGTGSMKIKDWMSIENANMATAQFKELAITIGQKQGKIQEGQVTIENFRESLSGQGTKDWFDKDVMMEVFETYGEAANRIQEYAEEHEVTSTEAIRKIKETDKEFADSIGFKAFAAAQEAKTFGEVVSATADAVSTKWMKIFENIFGDYLQAKELWTDLSEQMWEIFAQPLDTLNDIMSLWNKGFLTKGPQNIIETWFASGKLDDLENGLSWITDEVAQMAVASDKAKYKIETLADGTKRLVKTIDDGKGHFKTFYKNIYNPDDSLVSGRDNLLTAFQNIFDTVIHDVYDENGKLEHMSFFGALKRGLQEVVFGTSDVEKIIPTAAKKIWDLTNRFKELTEKLKPSLATSTKIKNVFKGLFTVFKVGVKFVKAAIKPFKDFFASIFSNKDKTSKSLLDIASAMSTWVQKLDKYLDRKGVYKTVSTFISTGLDKIKAGLDKVTVALTGLPLDDLVKKLKDDVYGFFTNYDFNGTWKKVKKFFDDVWTTFRNGLDDISILITGKNIEDLWSSIFSYLQNYDYASVFTNIGEFFSGIVEQFRQLRTGDLPEKLTPLQNFYLGLKGIFSAMREFFSWISPAFKWIGEFISNAFATIANTFSKKEVTESVKKANPIWEGMKKVFQGFVKFFEAIGPTLGKIGEWIGNFLGNLGESIAKWAEGKSPDEIIEKIIKGGFLIALTNLIRAITGIFKIPAKISGVLGSVKKVLAAYSREINASALIELALAVGIFAGSMWVIAQIPTDKMEQAKQALFTIAVALGAFALLKSKLSSAGEVVSEAAKGKEGLIEGLKSLLTATVGNSIFANDATAKFVKVALGVLFAALAAKKLVEAVMLAGNAMVELAKIDEDQIKRGGQIAAKIILVFGAFALFAGFSRKASSALFAALGAYVLVSAISRLIEVLAALGADDAKMDNIRKVIAKFSDVFAVVRQMTEWAIKIAAALTVAEIILAAFSTGKATDTFGMSKVMKQFGKNFLRVAASLLIIGAALAVIAGVAKNSTDTDFNAVTGFFSAIVFYIGLLQIAAIAIMSYSKNTKHVAEIMKQFGKNFLRIAASLLIVAIAFAAMGAVAKVLTAGELIGVSLIFTVFVAAVAILSAMALKASSPKKSEYFANNMKTIAKLFLAVALSLAIVASAFIIMDHLNMSAERMIGVSAIFGIFTLIVGAFTQVAISNASIKKSEYFAKNMNAISVLFLSVAGSFDLVAVAFAIMDGLDMNETAMWKVAGIFGAFAGVVAAMAGIGALIGKYGKEDAMLGIIEVGALMAAAAISIGVVAAAFAILASNINDAQMEQAVETIKWFGIVVGALALIGGIVNAVTAGAGGLGMLAIAGIILSIGTACLLAGAGIAVAVAAFGLFADGLAALVTAIAKDGPAFAENVDSVIKSLLQAITNNAELFVDAGWAIIASLASGIGKGIKTAGKWAKEQISSFWKTLRDSFNYEIDEHGFPIPVEPDTGSATEAADETADAYQAELEAKLASLQAQQPAELTEGTGSSLFDFSNFNIPGVENGTFDFAKVLGIKNIDTSSLTGLLGDSFKGMDFGSMLGGNFKLDDGSLDFSKFLGITSVDTSSLSTMFEEGFAGLDLGSIGDNKIGELLSSFTSETNLANVSTASSDVAEEIEKPIKDLDAASWGSDIGSELASGLRAAIPTVQSAASALAAAIKAILGFSEPEKGPLSDFHTYAPDMIKLWNKGVYSNLRSIKESTASVADTMYDGFSSALDYVSDLIDNGMSDQLTIRPVMDLSEIQNGVNSMNGMLSTPPTYTVMGTSRLAAAAAYGMGAMNSVATDPQASITDVGPTTNNFYISGADPNAIADRISKLLAQQTRRQKATWAKNK